MNRLPAEWESQAFVMLTWPRPDGNFAAFYDEAALCIHAIASTAALYQPVVISVHDPLMLDEVKALFAPRTLPHPIRFFSVPNNDVWARDHGPIGIHTDEGIKLCKFGFDGWGGKHASDRDNALVPALAKLGAYGDLPIVTQDLVMEGGAIETDGAGTLMGTRSSVLDPIRNPGKTVADIEKIISAAFGISRFIWLEHGGLAGDDTDGHIDTLARFVSTTDIVFQQSGGADDPNHADLSAMEAELKSLRRADGQPYTLHPLPAPGHHRNDQGMTLPAGYANFLIINGAVLVPTFAVDADTEALIRIGRLFPDRAVHGIDCRVLIRQYGALHCVTMNIPA